jgi:glycine cleavage system H protein
MFNMTHTQNLRYTSTHEWLDVESQPMTMGITEHAQNLLGDIVFVELPEVGQEVKAGQEIGVLESVKAAADFYAPISGTISEINLSIKNQPELINQDPFGQGWLCKITASNHAETSALLNQDSYSKEITQD